MPASKIAILTLTVLSTEALTENRAVDYDGSVATAAQAMHGIAVSDGDANTHVGVDVLGTSVATAGGAFALGDKLEVGSAGKLVAQSAGITVARALQAATADGDMAEVLLVP